MNTAPSTPHGRIDRVLLYGTVTLTGAAVMMLELLGTRVIGPFYGVSLYVWSALIAVTLIALALGYFLGGYMADRWHGIRLWQVRQSAPRGKPTRPVIAVLLMAALGGGLVYPRFPISPHL